MPNNFFAIPADDDSFDVFNSGEPDTAELDAIENEQEEQRECDSCGYQFPEDELEETDDNWNSGHICSDCISECEHCGGRFRYLSDHQDNWCDNCGEYVCSRMDMHYCDNCDTSRCDDCGEECNNCHGGTIHTYDYRPNVWRNKSVSHTERVFLGIELEIEGEESDIVDAVHSVDDNEIHLLMKHDGSVDGVEIVAHPATLEWSTNYFDYASMFRRLRNNRCHIRPRENGLHIHINRSAFREGPRHVRYGESNPCASHAMAWLMFIYRNTENIDGQDNIARRENDRWARFHRPAPGELRRKAQRIERGDRYVAVNCNNEHTYELRFFASTMRADEFYASLQFADATVEYTRQLQTADVLRHDALSWESFAAWCAPQGRYSTLTAALAGE